MRNIKQILGKFSILSLSLAMVIIPATSVFAGANEDVLLYMHDVDMITGDMDDKTEQTLKDNYWVDLEKRKVLNVATKANVDDKYMTGLFPKYITQPSDTAVNPIAAFHGLDLYSPVNNFPNTGIRSNGHTLDTAYYESLKWYAKLPSDAWRNPYNFTQDKILKADEVANPDEKLAVYSDLYAKGSSNSSEVGKYNRGDEIPLEFSLNLSWFKRYLNGFTLEMLGGGGTTLQNIDTRAGQFVVSDSGLAFTIDIPQGVSVSATPQVKVQGLEGFSATTSREDGKLVVRLSKDEKSKKYKWKELLERIYAIDASNIRVGISGLKVDNNAIPDSQITLKASVAGFYDFALSETEVFYSPQANNTIPLAANNTMPLATTNLPRNADRYYTFFAAKQSNEGRDANAPTDKPNLISYTFKVNKAPDNPGGGGGGGTTPDPGRVDGDDRVETGIEISKKYYDKAKTVIVVRHDLFPDSMTASVLAKLKDAPILLNPTNKLDPRVGAEIKRLGAEEVIIVGGPDSISEKVRGDLKAYDKDKDVERIAGVDRYGTSEMVARRVTGITGKKNTGVIASGQVFPDALSVGTFASRDGYPILLVKKNLVPDQVVRAIKDLDIKKTYIAGGTNTISKSTEAKLPGVLERMAGKDRYETSVAIAKSKFKDSREAFIASGEEFADALVISPVSGKYNRPTLLASRNKKTNAVVKKYIEESYLTSITAIGGEKYLPNSIMLDLAGK